MADKSSRALVIYGDGFAPLVTSSHSDLHSFASLSCCGFLSLRDSPPSENENEREVRELAQLLDAFDYYISLKGGENETDSEREPKEALPVQKISERFMGLSAALITASSTGIRSFARDIGFTVLQIDELIMQSNTGNDHPKRPCHDLSVTSELLQLLGFSKGMVLEKAQFDLVFFHIRANETVKVLKDKMAVRTDVEWLNKFVGEIMQTVNSQEEIASRLLFSTILSYGIVSEKDCTGSTASLAPMKMNSDLSLLRPRQSYTMKQGIVLSHIRNHHPMILAQWQNAVTRRDMSKEFTFSEIKQHGCNLSMLSDRFLHEVAFKLWKAPKYGA
ncbi:hypothetical protein ZOSMA_42G00330 [Zostera marina]|uniref:Uncharacterized protein n=1 Tax=Zostera marina TaxID=29655 RepID=A0A0K9P430_ZOSMR|nr:hypothetical protein ZOSMA_42G00330 [Zostera marina]